MTLKSDAKFEEKLTCGLKNDMRNLANLHQSTLSVKIGTLMGSFPPKSRKCLTLKFTEELCVIEMKNNAKFEEDLTCHFKIDMRNLTNLDLSNRKSR